MTIIPPVQSGRKGKYGFHNLQPGDNKELGNYTREGMIKVCSACKQYGDRHNMKFAVRKTDDKLVIWRTK